MVMKGGARSLDHGTHVGERCSSWAIHHRKYVSQCCHNDVVGFALNRLNLQSQILCQT